ncbi:hypothetical protein E2320_001040, partial [Naja naja]
MNSFGSLNFDNTTIPKLSSRLFVMPLLKKLGLNNNHLGSQMSSHLAEVLKATTQIEEIESPDTVLETDFRSSSTGLQLIPLTIELDCSNQCLPPVQKGT